jgi:hypothetical protein
MNAQAIWYADGLRWIGSLFNDAADHLEHAAIASSDVQPRYQPIDEYLSDVRTRVHIHF